MSRQQKKATADRGRGVVSFPFHPGLVARLRPDPRFWFVGNGWAVDDRYIVDGSNPDLSPDDIAARQVALFGDLVSLVAEYFEIEEVPSAAAN